MLAESPPDTVVVPLPCAHDVALRLDDAELVPEALAPDRLLAELMRTRLLAAGARPGRPGVGLDLVADVLGDHPHVAETVARRYRAAVAHRFALSLA